MWYLVTRWPIQPRPFCALATQLVGQVGDAVHQRISERYGQADKDQPGQDGDDGDGGTPAREQPPLQEVDARVEQQCDEPGHDYQQQDVPNPVDQLPGQIGGRHHRDRGHDRRQRDFPPFGRPPQAR
jgi:hypothetical protein